MSGKAVHLKQAGPPGQAVLDVVDAAAPAAPAGKVVVRMKLCPVNPADIFSLMAVYPGFNSSGALPAVPGLEGMGVVHALGEGVSGFSVGQRVVPLFIVPGGGLPEGSGSWQEWVVADPQRLFAVPDAVPDASAAQLVVNPFTAIAMLRELAIPAGGWLLQTAGGSVLGRQVIQLAKHMGIKTISTVRREALVAELKALGADAVLLESEDYAARVKEITGGAMAYGAIDACAGGETARCTSSLRNGGCVLVYGAMNGMSLQGSVVDTLFRGCQIRGFWVTPHLAQAGPARAAEYAAEAFSLMASGVLTPHSGKAFPATAVNDAVAEAVAPARGGKAFISFF